MRGGWFSTASLVATLDAMGCQRRIAREIKEADPEHVLALKDNQGSEHIEKGH